MKACLTFVLFAAAVLFAGTAMAATPATDAASLLEEAPQMSTLEDAPDVETTQEPLFLAPSLGKELCPHPNPGINCSNWNSSYCTYAWDCQCCCAPTYVAPGASCPKICI